MQNIVTYFAVWESFFPNLKANPKTRSKKNNNKKTLPPSQCCSYVVLILYTLLLLTSTSRCLIFTQLTVCWRHQHPPGFNFAFPIAKSDLSFCDYLFPHFLQLHTSFLFLSLSFFLKKKKNLFKTLVCH